jgi:hypothetical protein
MARSTFDGPILSGDSRFGPIRDVGYADLTQTAFIDFSNTTSGTANYSGGSGVFVNSNLIPNLPGNIYSPQAGVGSNAGPTVVTPTADTTSNIYRGAVMYLPINSVITGVDIFLGTAITVTGTTPTFTAKIGNQFNGSQYGSVSAVATGKNTIAMTASEVNAWNGTTLDFQNPNVGTQPAFFSQVVFTFNINGASSDLASLSAGTLNFVLKYRQYDANIGNMTTYPYGNFD